MNKAEQSVFKSYTTRLQFCPLADRWAIIEKELHALGYFNAPASSKYHLSVEGGLATHSIAVTALALLLAKAARGSEVEDVCEGGLADWRIIIAGLLHDVGKCGVMTEKGLQVRYKPKSTFVKHKGFSVVYPEMYFTTRDLSALYAARWGLPGDIVQAILTHDGLYDPANRAYEDHLTPLALLIRTADFWQAKGFEGITNFVNPKAAWLPKSRVILPDNGGPVLPRPPKGPGTGRG